MLQSLGVYSPEVHAALREVRARELARRLEAAVALACDGPAEFKLLFDTSWFKRSAPLAQYPDLHLLDLDGTYPLVRELSHIVAVYIRKKRRVLFPEELGQRKKRGI